MMGARTVARGRVAAATGAVVDGRGGSHGEDWRDAFNGLLGRREGPSTDEINSFLARLALCGGLKDLPGPELIDRLDALERLKAAASGEQARVQVAFAELCEAGIDPRAAALESATGRSAARTRERSAAAQIALARKVSPSRGARLLAMSKRLVGEMPHTFQALAAGRLTEERALFVAEGVEVLSAGARSAVDEDLAGDPRRFEGLGDRGVQNAVRAAVDAIDDGAGLARVRKAEQERRVTVRRLPDAMAQLTAILPVAQAIAVGGALRAEGGAARAAGDGRTMGQIAADTLVERVTGQSHADAVPLRVGLVMTSSSLFEGGREPALLQGYGTVAAGQARAMVAASSGGGSTSPSIGAVASAARPSVSAVPRAVESGARPSVSAVPSAASLAGVWLRRLYLDPSTGELAAMDSKSRRFPRALAQFIETRDQVCRRPYCEAPIRHIDHVVPVASGGETSVENGQGLCEACNHAKESLGWEHAVVGSEEPDGTRGDILTVTPTGHEYFSPPPTLPGALPRTLPREGRLPLEGRPPREWRVS
ncbi:HNH endonuclease [Sinomonas sp.]|uniref:HNH endonuclease n=1 Tax=Sinomonas sp. TaxID=1914986 RepID=UPI002FE1F926